MDPLQPQTSNTYLIQRASMQIISGGSAGLIEIGLMHPLDLVKTRFQIQQAKGSANDPKNYRNLRDCFVKMYRSEGLLSFYKGILPPLLAEVPKRAIKFCSFEQYKRLFAHDSMSLSVTFALAGLASGVTEGFFICPFEVIKIILQTDRSAKRQTFGKAFDIAKSVVKSDGIAGLYKGLAFTMSKHAVWNSVYFGVYHSVIQEFPPPAEPNSNFAYRFGIGMLAGILASLMNTPFDTAKSRIQAPPEPISLQLLVGQMVRKTFGRKQAVSMLKRLVPLNEGLLLRLLRLGPGGGIMMVVYDFVFTALNTQFD